MKAVTWPGKRDVRVEEAPDPRIELPTDAIIKVTSTNICGSDLHLYETLGAFMTPGDVLGHEAMGTVVEVGAEVTAIGVGDRVVIPFQMSCGHCFMCNERLYSQCETTQVTEYGTGAALFGYSKLYGEVPGGQAASDSRRAARGPAAAPRHRRVGAATVTPTSTEHIPGHEAHPTGR
jgi:threonine dehydrogenase-like Zn-dependent dehydrogenase